jgi:tetratricopeptide (TPR) repeat protein
MHPPRSAIILACTLLLAFPAAGESLRTFAERHGLSSTLRQWWVERLRSGAASVRMEAAKALGAEGVLYQADASITARERAELLRLVVAALPPQDPSAMRPRLEVARQDLGLAALRIDALRADVADETALRESLEALARVEDALRPIQSRMAESGANRDRGSALREPAQLLDGWQRTLQAWIDRRVASRVRDRRKTELEIQRAIIQFARLIDIESESPAPGDASQDLLKTELGADAGLGLAVALQVAGRAAEAEAWLQAIETDAAQTDAARRVPLWRLGFAVDARDAVAMRAAIERMSARGIPSSLAIAAARTASRVPGADGSAVVAAAVAAMDPAGRAEWLAGLESTKGPLQGLAQGLREADRRLERWQRGDRTGAAEATELLVRGLADAGDVAPASMRAEAFRALGWAHRASGAMPQASAAFEAAADASPALASECLWLAALSVPSQEDAGRERTLQLLARQRALDPKGPYAGRVAAWTSRLGGLGSDALAIAVLLDVPLTDPFLADARCEAARRILASAPADSATSRSVAERALRALEPVVHVPQVARWRLIAAVRALDVESARQAALALRPEDLGDATVRSMLVQVHALQGETDRVRALLAQIPQPESARAALAASFALASVAGPEAAIAALDLALVVLESDPSDESLRGVARDRAARAMVRTADEGVALPAELAARAVQALVVERAVSRAEDFAAAEALRSAGRANDAIERLQRIGGSLSQGSEPWAEARWRLHRALLASDPARARRMLEQHLTLVPDGGPAPWGPRLVQAAGGTTP